MAINYVRSFTSYYVENETSAGDDVMSFLTSFLLSTWPSFSTPSSYLLKNLNYNLALERAARHIVNTQDRCMTDGDANTDTLETVLLKYYAHSVDNLRVLRITSNYFMFDDSYIGSLYSDQERYFRIDQLNWILSQQNIDKTLFSSNENDQIGIACGCANKEDWGNYLYETYQEQVCYFVTARNVVAKDIYERLPEPQYIMPAGDVCFDYCPYRYDVTYLAEFTLHPENYWMTEEQKEVADHPLEVKTFDNWLKSCDEINFQAVNCEYDEYYPPTDPTYPI